MKNSAPTLVSVGTVSCTQVWDDATAQSFGTGGACAWLDHRRMQIMLGHDSVNLRKLSLVPRADIFIQATSKLPELAFAAKETSNVANMQAQTLVVEGPVPYCLSSGVPSARLWARLSGTVAARPGPLSWTVGTAAPVTTDYLDIKYFKLTTGNHNVTAQMKDSAGALLASAETVIVVQLEKILAYFAGGNQLNVQRAGTTVLQAQLFSDGCTHTSSGSDATYKVVLTNMCGVKGHSACDSNGSWKKDWEKEANGLEMLLSPHELAKGTYKAKLYQEGGVAIAAQTVEVRLSPLVAKIAGGTYLSILKKTKTTLRAVWPDPDSHQPAGVYTYTYTWSCSDCGTSFAETKGTTTATLSELSLAQAGSYVVHLEIESSDGRSAQGSVTMAVFDKTDAAADGHIVSVYAKDLVPSGTEQTIVLDGVLSSSTLNPTLQKLGSLQWTALSGDINTPEATSAIDLASNTKSTKLNYALSKSSEITKQLSDSSSAVVSLILDASKLLPGRNYMFALTSSSADAAGTELKSSARAVVAVAYPPGNYLETNARLSVEPSTGEALSQQFVIRARGFVTASSKLPLTYTYGIRTGVSTQNHVIGESHSSALTSVILPENAKYVGVRVKNSDGSSTAWSWSAVTVTAKYFDDATAIRTFLQAPVQYFLSANVQRMQAVAMHLASANSDVVVAVATELKSVAKLVTAMSSSPLRAQLLGQMSQTGAYLSSKVGKDSASGPVLASVLALVLSKLTDEYGALHWTSAVAAVTGFDGLVTPAALQAVSSITGSNYLVQLNLAVGHLQNILCAAIEYDQRPLTETSSLVEFTALRSAATKVTTPKITMGILSTSTDVLRRSASKCVASLQKGGIHTAACSGGCISVASINADVRSVTGPGLLVHNHADFPIAATLKSSATRTLLVSNAGARRQRATSQQANTVEFKQIKNCSQPGEPCVHCREWSAASKQWVESTTTILASGAVVCAPGQAASSVGIFESCAVGLVGRNCLNKCPMGLYGVGCKQVNNCSNHGRNDYADGTCDCYTGYTGTTCQFKCTQTDKYTTPKKATSFDQGFGPNCAAGCSCAAEGTASCDSQSGACTCKTGYSGTTCAVNNDDCASDPCKHKGTCIDKVNRYECSCTGTGYYGTHCETLVDECKGNSCENNGTCVDGLGAFTCTCEEGFDGVFCESYCPDGKYGPKCALSCNCKKEGVCHARTGKCACSPGWSGSDCGTHQADETRNMIIAIVIPIILIVVIVCLVLYKRAGRKKTFPINRDAFLITPEKNKASTVPANTGDPFQLMMNKPGLEQMLGDLPKPAIPESGLGAIRNTPTPGMDSDAAEADSAAKTDADSRVTQSGRAKLEFTVHKYSAATGGDADAEMQYEELSPMLFISQTDDTTLAILRERLRTTYASLTTKGTAFYFKKSNSKDRHPVSHEPTLFVKNCYDGKVDVEVVPYKDNSVKSDFCTCGNVNQFICSNCNVQGYCSSACQKSNWKQHKVDCQEQQAKKSATSQASAAKADTVDAAKADIAEPKEATESDKCGNVTCDKEPIFDCSSCGSVAYCCRKCQKDDWKRHKPSCQKRPKTPKRTKSAAAAKAALGTEAVETPKAQPIAEAKTDEPTAEAKVDEPAAEPKADEPAAEPKADEPAAEPKADEPVAEAKTDEPVAEGKADEPADETKADADAKANEPTP